jgi:S1-C subfamily serine protease
MTRADIGTVEAGDEIYTMGAPRKLRFSLSHGMVAFVGRPFSGAFYLQTDLPANSGSSGGPVLNERGEVVAITSFVLKDTEGLAFALPVEYAFDRFASVLAPTERATRVFAAWRDAMVTANAAPIR